MAKKFLDTTGMKCPLPILKLATMMPTMKTGDLLEITGDCETFDNDIKKWCAQMGIVLVLLTRKETGFKAEIQF